jgi:hypothetical protein
MVVVRPNLLYGGTSVAGSGLGGFVAVLNQQRIARSVS